MKKYMYTMLIVAINFIVFITLFLLLNEILKVEETKVIVFWITILTTSLSIGITSIYFPNKIIKKQNQKKLNMFLAGVSIDSETVFEKIVYFIKYKNLRDFLDINYELIELFPKIYQFGDIEFSVKLIMSNLDTILLTFSKDVFSVCIFDKELNDKLYECFFYNEFDSVVDVFERINILTSSYK